MTVIYIKYLYGIPILLYDQWEQLLKSYAAVINLFFVSIQNQFFCLIHVHVILQHFSLWWAKKTMVYKTLFPNNARVCLAFKHTPWPLHISESPNDWHILRKY